MPAKLALSISVAVLVLVTGGFLAVLARLDDLQERIGRPEASAPRGRPPGVVHAVPGEGAATPEQRSCEDLPSIDPLLETDVQKKIDHLYCELVSLREDQFDREADLGRDLLELRQEIRQMRGMLRRTLEGMQSPLGLAATPMGLVPAGRPLTDELLDSYRKAAQARGMVLEEGRVTVRGFVNPRINPRYPIEYFMTRYPEKDHETLVLLVADWDPEARRAAGEDEEASGLGGLEGIVTALYKGLVAVGFREGRPTHPAPGSDPKRPEWVLPTGDVVYIGVRYEQGGQRHVARATDWVVDPATGKVLPPDAFRFTGSDRVESTATGEEMLGAEATGLVVSVWPSRFAMFEVALESAMRNDYQYHAERIPTAAEEGLLFVDVIFSRTPIEPQGDGAAPLGDMAPEVEPARSPR